MVVATKRRSAPPKRQRRDEPFVLVEWLQRKISGGRGDPGEKRTRRQRTHFSLWYFLIAFLILSFINTQLLREEVTRLQYSEFKVLVTTGRVLTAELGREHIKGTFKESGSTKKFRTVRVEDPKLVEL
ncbi:MAG: hypothetical protein ACE5H5_04620, partial [Nitrospinota bacterium]